MEAVESAMPRLWDEPGVIGLANTLVHVEKQFTGLADQLLAERSWSEVLTTEIAIARKYRQVSAARHSRGRADQSGGFP